MGLFGGVKDFIAWQKLGLQLSRLRSSFEDFQRSEPMSWKSAVLNALKHAAISLGSVFAAAGAAWLAGPDAAGIITKDMSPTIAVAAIPLIHMGAVALQNALKVKAQ